MRRWIPVLTIITLLTFVVPVAAQEPIDQIPEPALTNTGRGDIAIAINKLPLVLGEFEYSGADLHGAFVNYLDEVVSEIVYIGDELYVRENEETRWKTGNVADPVDPFIPVFSNEGVAIYNMGSVTVNGVETTQYQIRIDPATFPEDSDLTSASVDFFIGVSDNYLHKQQITLRGTDPDLGDLELEVVIVYSDFNAAVVIGRPSADLVDEVGLDAATHSGDFMGSGMLPLWLRPAVGSAFAELR